MASRLGLGLQLGELQCRVEREVDVVAEEQVAGKRRAVERREPVPAGLRRVEQLAVVRQVERAGHSTTTSTSCAAASARSSASTFVSAIAIT